MTPPRWPVVLFDFDGTLGDTVGLIVASFQHAFSTVVGHQVSEIDARSWIGRPLQDLLEETHPAQADELVAVYRSWNLQHHDELIRAVPGIPTVLDALARAGVRTAVVSSKTTELVLTGLAVLGLDGYGLDVIGQGDTAHHKPHPEPLLLAASRLGVAPADCVYVGDAVVDVRAAAAAGMDAVAVTWGAGTPADLRAAGAEILVEDAAELAGVLGLSIRSGWSTP